ncbi:MAG TPA: T9SS type A sorting domain-containing protein, partial [Bacteroidales bacterium]|nr:T9SS type A sorting domain-containing protein [Bacteroidales bacterium]
QGQYLPLVFFRQQSTNYPDDLSFGLHTSVGTNAPTSGEAINVMPAVVGASLCGIDKSNQFGYNWALMCQEFFNKRPAENIYLNHPATSSGNDWWYETIPNIFFLQLKSLYPEIAVFDEQLEPMASQWFKALQHMGASATPWTLPEMNYRAWEMSTMSPLTTGVPEPEAAGAIAWIMYQTYQITELEDYRMAAEWALEFMDNLGSNPSYELQLPYGVYTAARMNAEIGTNYDIEKMLNWVFDRGHLRGWGTIVGNWGGFDCSGLVGEANDQGNDYAFMMNGFQHAAALVPMLRYDKRFATAIAKWILNLANASRLFYPQYLPPDFQDNWSWANAYDPNSVIAYEAIKEVKNGKSPYATGDAIDGGWSQTNLMLYSSSHVGYLAALIDITDVEGILQIDLLKTDFYHAPAYPGFLLYNPHSETKTVTLPLPEGIFDIYDALSGTVILYDQSGQSLLQIETKSSTMPVLIPAGSEIVEEGSKSMVNGIVIDYNNGNMVTNHSPRIKSLGVHSTLVETKAETQIYCTAEDSDDDLLTYEWWLNGDPQESGSVYTFLADESGLYMISCKVSDLGGLSDSTAIIMEAVDKIPLAPEIVMLKAMPRKCEPSQIISLECLATDANNDSLSFVWHDFQGQFIGDVAEVSYTVPALSGNYYVNCIVTDTDGLSASDSLMLMVREFPASPAGELVARYPLYGNALDINQNQLHGTAGGGVSWGDNAAGEPQKSACLNGTSAHISLPSNPLFNYTQSMSLAFFIKIEQFYEREQYIISHGSWQNRYKISISNNRIRFTVNTTNGIFDLDSEMVPESGKWYHIAAVYNGNDAELWVDAGLDNFMLHTGSIQTSTINPVIGQHLPGNNDFNFHGCINNVSFYNYGLLPAEIESNLQSGLFEILNWKRYPSLIIFPNPAIERKITIQSAGLPPEKLTYSIFDMTGRVLQTGKAFPSGKDQNTIFLDYKLRNGVYMVRIISNAEQKHGIFILQR